MKRKNTIITILLSVCILIELSVIGALIVWKAKPPEDETTLSAALPEDSVAEEKPAQSDKTPPEEKPAVPRPAALPESSQPETGQMDSPLPEEAPEPQPDPREQAVHRAMDGLSDALARELSGLDGKWAVYVEDMQTGYAVRGEQGSTCDDSMVSASIIKIFVMAALYDRINQGEFTEEALYSDIYQMITRSDNAATNRLVTVLGGGDPQTGMDRVNEYAQSIGCGNTSMQRLMLDYNGKQNYVSAVDCAVLLRMIFDRTCVSEAYSDQMLSILKDQYWGDYIPKGPPEGTVIAHKGGELPGVCHGDVGIVYDKAGTYIVCIICNDPVSDGECKAAVGEIAVLIDSYMSQR